MVMWAFSIGETGVCVCVCVCLCVCVCVCVSVCLCVGMCAYLPTGGGLDVEDGRRLVLHLVLPPHLHSGVCVCVWCVMERRSRQLSQGTNALHTHTTMTNHHHVAPTSFTTHTPQPHSTHHPRELTSPHYKARYTITRHHHTHFTSPLPFNQSQLNPLSSHLIHHPRELGEVHWALVEEEELPVVVAPPHALARLGMQWG